MPTTATAAVLRRGASSRAGAVGKPGATLLALAELLCAGDGLSELEIERRAERARHNRQLGARLIPFGHFDAHLT